MKFVSGPRTPSTLISVLTRSDIHCTASSHGAFSSSMPDLPRRLISWSGFTTTRADVTHGLLQRTAGASEGVFSGISGRSNVRLSIARQ
jgi:hypothetical protein